MDPPVGAGATGYRNETLSQLLKYRPTVIRGNASEILALAKQNTETTKGVDSTAQSNEALSAAQSLNRNMVCGLYFRRNRYCGERRKRNLSFQRACLMAKVTGMGCSASALIGAFIAVVEEKTEAVAAAMALMGVAGELAEKQSAGPPGSLQMHLLDKLHNLTEAEFISTLKISEK